MRPVARVTLALAAFLVCHACDFDTEARVATLGDGEIRAHFVRDDGSPASGAVAAAHGSARLASADDDGRIVFTGLVPGRWLVKVTEDDDGDGVAERGTWLTPVSLTLEAVPKNLTDGCTGQAPPLVVNSVVLSERTPLALEKTGAIAGNVTGIAAGQEARVVVWRTIDGHATSVEGSSGVADDGSWRIDGVVAGAVHVMALVYDAADIAGPYQPLTFGVVESTVDVDGDRNGVDIDATEDARAAGQARTTPAQVDAQWTLPDPATLEVSQATFEEPDAALPGDIGFPFTDGAVLADAQQSFVLDLPIGMFDINLTTSALAGGRLRHAVVVPDGDVLGPVEIVVQSDACVVECTGDDDCGAAGVVCFEGECRTECAAERDCPDQGECEEHPNGPTTCSVARRDCDRDGLRGLARPADFADEQYAACVAACEDAFGAAGEKTVCEGDVDCDDDGDGQPDVTEFLDCIGPGIGTDLDGDDLCEPAQDPFPSCAAADGAGCPVAFTPPPARF